MAGGAGGREPYTSNDISNKYIFDTFSMIYLSIFLLFFTLKELIRDLQRL